MCPCLFVHPMIKATLGDRLSVCWQTNTSYKSKRSHRLCWRPSWWTGLLPVTYKWSISLTKSLLDANHLCMCYYLPSPLISAAKTWSPVIGWTYVPQTQPLASPPHVPSGEVWAWISKNCLQKSVLISSAGDFNVKSNIFRVKWSLTACPNALFNDGGGSGSRRMDSEFPGRPA